MKAHEHICLDVAEINLAEAFKLDIEKLDGTWFLNQTSLATEYDVRGGEAEFAGEIMGRRV